MNKWRPWMTLGVGVFGMVFLLVGALGCSQAEQFPSKPIVISVVSKAGSPNDLIARAQAKGAEKILNQPVVVENRDAGAGMATLSHVASQPADGYSIASIGQGQEYLAVMADSPVKPSDFVGLIRQSQQPGVIFVRSDSEWKTIEDLIKYAKENPGKLRLGGTGVIYQHPAMRLAETAGIEISYVMYGGGTEVITNLLGGHVDTCLMSPPNALPHVKAGKLVPLAVGSDTRIDYLDAPTFKEKGIDFVFWRWAGLMVKADTPADRIDVLHDAFKKATETAEWKQLLEQQHEQDAYMGPDDLTKLWNDEIEDAREYLKSTGQAVRE